jgi:hypothetical protein
MVVESTSSGSFGPDRWAARGGRRGLGRERWQVGFKRIVGAAALSVGEAAFELVLYITVAMVLTGVAAHVYTSIIARSQEATLVQSANDIGTQALYNAALYSLDDASVDPSTHLSFVGESAKAVQGGSFWVMPDPDNRLWFTIGQRGVNAAVCLETSGTMLVPGVVMIGRCH